MLCLPYHYYSLPLYLFGGLDYSPDEARREEKEERRGNGMREWPVAGSNFTNSGLVRREEGGEKGRVVGAFGLPLSPHSLYPSPLYLTPPQRSREEEEGGLMAGNGGGNDMPSLVPIPSPIDILPIG